MASLVRSIDRELDSLQKAARGRVVPESFTHGSSAERVRWLKAGMASGRVAACDTFAAGTR